jgi:hypothetical protein
MRTVGEDPCPHGLSSSENEDKLTNMSDLAQSKGVLLRNSLMILKRANAKSFWARSIPSQNMELISPPTIKDTSHLGERENRSGSSRNMAIEFIVSAWSLMEPTF